MASDRVQRQIERILDEAEKASAENNREVLHERAQHVLTFDPNNPDGLVLLAAAKRALGLTGSSSPAPWVPTAPPTAAPTTPTNQPPPSSMAATKSSDSSASVARRRSAKAGGSVSNTRINILTPTG